MVGEPRSAGGAGGASVLHGLLLGCWFLFFYTPILSVAVGFLYGFQQLSKSGSTPLTWSMTYQKSGSAGSSGRCSFSFFSVGYRGAVGFRPVHVGGCRFFFRFCLGTVDG